MNKIRKAKKFYSITNERLSKEIIQLRFVILYGLLGITIFMSFAIVNFIVKDYFAFVLEVSLTIIILIGLYFTIHYKSLFYARSFGLIPIIAITVNNFVLGGFQGTGILMCYSYPLVTFFIAGRKRGIYLNIGFLAFTFIYFVTSKLYSIKFNYSDFEYSMFVLSFLLVSSMTLIYQLAWDFSEEYITKQKRAAEGMALRLKLQVQETLKAQKEMEKAYRRMEKTNQKLEQINSIMLGREQRMIELKKEIKMFKRALKAK